MIAGAGLLKYAGAQFVSFKNAYMRAALSGLLSKYSYDIASKAKKHASESGKRIDILEDLKKSFVNNGGAGFSSCTTEERENSASPGCFCFTETGNVDEAKKSLQVCKDHFAQASGPNAGQYGVSSASTNSGLKGCFGKNKSFDPTCSCRAKALAKAKKDGKKVAKDNCLKFSGKVNLGSLSKLGGLKNLVKDSVNFNRGNISTGDLTGSANGVNKLIGKINKKKKALLKDKKFAPILKKVNKLERKLARSLSNRVKKGLADGSIKSPFGSGLSGGGSTDPKDILKDFEKSIKAVKPDFKSGKNLGKKGGKRNLNDFNFDEGGTDSAQEIDDLANVMKKDYNFNDINDNPGNNIFKIITNRYQRSGLRRLFDDKGVSKADEANESDINQQ